MNLNWKCGVSIANMCGHFKPSYQITTLWTLMFGNLLANPLWNPYLSHAKGIGNHIGMVTDPVDYGLCAELMKFVTRKFRALKAANDIVAGCTIQKSMVGAISASLAHKVRKATMTFIRECWTSTTKQATYGSASFVRGFLHTSTFNSNSDFLSNYNSLQRGCKLVISGELIIQWME